MRRVARVLVLVLAAVGGSLLYFWLPSRASIPDVRHPTELILKAKHRTNHIYALEVVGSGSIQGDAEIALILNGAPYKTVRLNGPVHFVWSGDWYSPEATVRYTPLSVSAGSIELRYRFESL